jgi:hypothetical protein
MKQLFSKRNLLALTALLIGGLLVIYFGSQSQFASASKPLADIRSIETLRTQFNHDAGKTRLILLMVPT